MSTHRVMLFPLVLGLAVLLSAIPAAGGTGRGVSSKCFVVNPNRFQCNFASFETLEVTIQYVSMQCGSTGGTSFSLQEFQVLTTPTNSSSEVAYQIPIRVPASLVGVVNTGSPVTIYAGANSGARALIDLVPAPKANTTQCTVSLSYAQD